MPWIGRTACTEYWVAAVLPFPAAFEATFAATSTVTVPLADGVMVTVAFPFVSAHAVTRPLPTVTSACSNPLTASEKVMVTVKAPVCTAVGPVMATVGRFGVTVTENVAVTAAFTPSSALIVTVYTCAVAPAATVPCT